MPWAQTQLPALVTVALQQHTNPARRLADLLGDLDDRHQWLYIWRRWRTVEAVAHDDSTLLDVVGPVPPLRPLVVRRRLDLNQRPMPFIPVDARVHALLVRV